MLESNHKTIDKQVAPAKRQRLNSIAHRFNAMDKTEAYRTQVKNISNYVNMVQRFDQIKALGNQASFGEIKDYVHEAMPLIHHFSKRKRRHVFEETWVARLNQPETWQAYLNQQMTEARQEEIKQLQALWQQQQRFCRYKNDYLMDCYDQLRMDLKEIEQAIKACEQKRSKDEKMASTSANADDSFLTKLQTQGIALKKDLLQTMYTRLYVAGAMAPYLHHVCYDDVLMYVLRKLKALNVIQGELSEGCWESLEPKHFAQFHRYLFESKDLTYSIEQNKALTWQNRLLHLPWFNEWNASEETYASSPVLFTLIEGHPYLVPKMSIGAIPAKRRWPDWLFSDSNRCIELIETYQALFATIKLGFPVIKPVLEQERFRQMDDYEEKLGQALVQFQAQKPAWWQFWHRKQRQLITATEMLVQSEREICREQRVKALQDIAHWHAVPKENREARHQCWLVIREQAQKLEVGHPLKNQLDEAIQTLCKELEQGHEGDFALCLIKALVNEQTLALHEINYLTIFLEINQWDPDKQIFEVAALGAWQRATIYLLDQINEAFNDPEFDLQSPIFIATLKLFNMLADKNDQQSLNKLFVRLFKNIHQWNQGKPFLEAINHYQAVMDLAQVIQNPFLIQWIMALPDNIKKFADIKKAWANQLKQFERIEENNDIKLSIGVEF